MSSFFDGVLASAGIPRSRGYDFYFREQVFGRSIGPRTSMLDLGGGNGLASFWAVQTEQASSSVIADPLTDGSNAKMLEEYERLRQAFPIGLDVSRFQGTIQDLPQVHGSFDVILMNNVINHVHEDLVANLHRCPSPSPEFTQFFRDVASRLSRNGVLIVTDCARRNAFGDMGLRNPMAPTINWQLHQGPSVWIKLAHEAGLRVAQSRWNSRRELGRFGQAILGTPAGAYLTTSHFTLHFTLAGGT